MWVDMPAPGKEGVKIEIETAPPPAQSQRLRRPPRPAAVTGGVTNVSIPRQSIPKGSASSKKGLPVGWIAAAVLAAGGILCMERRLRFRLRSGSTG
jgi:hypothetical protein